MPPEHPTTRLLTTLELLQTHGRLNGHELAQRLQIDRRTVRRYIAMLEEMGIPVTTERGPHGGYQLLPGYKLPPMMFTPDEAIALSLGLAAVRRMDIAPAAAAAQSKLERVLPPAIRERLRAVTESVTFSPFQTEAAHPFLSILSTAAHTTHGVRLTYQTPQAATTTRDFDPYGLAFKSGRWYTVGFCHLRHALRSFRLDRILTIDPQPRRFHRDTNLDILAYLTTSIATLPRQFTIEVLLHTNLESARRQLFPEIGVLEPKGKKTALHSQADDLTWFARELSRLPFRFQILRPPQLLTALKGQAHRLLRIQLHRCPSVAKPLPLS